MIVILEKKDQDLQMKHILKNHRPLIYLIEEDQLQLKKKGQVKKKLNDILGEIKLDKIKLGDIKPEEIK